MGYWANSRAIFCYQAIAARSIWSLLISQLDGGRCAASGGSLSCPSLYPLGKPPQFSRFQIRADTNSRNDCFSVEFPLPNQVTVMSALCRDAKFFDIVRPQFFSEPVLPMTFEK
jgi:hypothetical protein